MRSSWVWVLSFITAICYAEPPKQASPPSVAGTVATVSGSAFLIRSRRATDSKENPPIPIKPTTQVFELDSIKTEDDGRVKILMVDQSVIDVHPNGLLKVTKYEITNQPDRNINLDVMFGKVRTSVAKKLNNKSRFQIKTPTATMGVRGTEFVINSPENSARTDIAVLKGQLNVTPTSPVDMRTPTQSLAIKEGFQMTSSADGSTSSFKLNAESIQQLATESTVPDNTFQKSVKVESKTQSASSGSESTTSSALAETVTSISHEKKNADSQDSSAPTEKKAADLIGTVKPSDAFILPPPALVAGGVGTNKVHIIITK